MLLTQQPACRQIPARESSVWYPGIYPGRLSFTTEYPERPPTFKFLPIDGKPLFHPNVFNDGKIYWWEGLIMTLIYFLYIAFMVFNEKIFVSN